MADMARAKGLPAAAARRHANAASSSSAKGKTASGKPQKARKRRKKTPESTPAAKKAAPANPTSSTVTLQKRAAPRGPHRPQDLYVSRSSSFAAQLERAKKLLDSDHREVCIHGLGAAINRAINLALQLEKFYAGAATVHVETSTVRLIDDLQPHSPDEDDTAQVRSNSAVHITVTKLAVEALVAAAAGS
eukprot:m.74355 g.74355  ORF g.74355 m.74355 type:complete len:190 (+) comp8052_c2_seq1:135-704(+)